MAYWKKAYKRQEEKMGKNILYLASQSKTRQYLLQIAKIPYQILKHKSDECGIDLTGSFEEYVLAIAQHKMEHVVLPTPEKSETIFVLTADTLMKIARTKEILGKPLDREDAKRMLKAQCGETIELATGCCLEKKEYRDGRWVTLASKHWTSPVTLEFCVEEEYVEDYLSELPHALNVCGAGMIRNIGSNQDFGLNFLKSINGSYTSVLGLPLFELREVLKNMGFSL